MNTSANPLILPEMTPALTDDFVRRFSEIQTITHDINIKNGWWKDRLLYLESGLPNAHANTVCALAGLAHTEISEAVEAARKQPLAAWGDAATKDTMVREVAGTVVRLMDWAEAFGLPLAEAIVEELKANAARGYRHGGKAA